MTVQFWTATLALFRPNGRGNQHLFLELGGFVVLPPTGDKELGPSPSYRHSIPGTVGLSLEHTVLFPLWFAHAAKDPTLDGTPANLEGDWDLGEQNLFLLLCRPEKLSG